MNSFAALRLCLYRHPSLEPPTPQDHLELFYAPPG
jgi:hypothetical protein